MKATGQFKTLRRSLPASSGNLSCRWKTQGRACGKADRTWSNLDGKSVRRISSCAFCQVCINGVSRAPRPNVTSSYQTCAMFSFALDATENSHVEVFFF